MSCKECVYAPKTYDEYCIAQQNPSLYCPDAYTEISYLCSYYGGCHIANKTDDYYARTRLKDIISTLDEVQKYIDTDSIKCIRKEKKE